MSAIRYTDINTSSEHFLLRSPKYIPILLLTTLGTLIFFREPAFFLNARIWAEEGSLYFQYAYNHSWGASLLASHLGYFSLFTNITSVIAAKLIHLEQVANFFLWASLCIQLIPLGIIWYSKSPLWDKLWKKVLGIAIILFAPLSGEIWLNTINSQFYLSLITFLILFEEEPLTQLKKWVYRIFLIVSGLTGMLSVFLLPTFLISLYWNQHKERRIQTGILMIAGVIQGFVFLSTFSQESLYYTRFQGVEPYQFPLIVIIKSVLVTFAGPHGSTWILENITTPINTPILVIGSLLIIFAILYGCSDLIKTKERTLFIGAYLSLLGLSMISALGKTSDLLAPVYLAQRYFYVPNVILLLMVFRNVQMGIKKKKLIALSVNSLLITLALINGVLSFQFALSYQHDGPRWLKEVEHWKGNQETPLKIMPEGWKIELHQQTAPYPN